MKWKTKKIKSETCCCMPFGKLLIFSSKIPSLGAQWCTWCALANRVSKNQGDLLLGICQRLSLVTWPTVNSHYYLLHSDLRYVDAQILFQATESIILPPSDLLPLSWDSFSLYFFFFLLFVDSSMGRIRNKRADVSPNRERKKIWYIFYIISFLGW